MILDGVVDPNIWISYKVTSNVADTYTAPTHPFHQTLQHSLVDTEKTFSGLTDGCAKAGRAGCKLVEITGDNATGDDVKNLITYSHDVTDSLTRTADGTDSRFHLRLTWSSIAKGIQFLSHLAS